MVLQFEQKEYKNIYSIWQILREVEKWNERGFVDLNEREVQAKKATSASICFKCGAEYKDGQKFCGECGAKIQVAS